jgi:cbb3-type cytochrome oxidase maturation protein
MDVIVYLIPIALFLGLLGLGAFLWSLRSGQFDDLDGAAHRILFDDDEEKEEEDENRAGKDRAEKTDSGGSRPPP